MFLLSLAAALLTQLAPTEASQQRPQTDQTVGVARGARLQVSAFAGEILIRAWDRDAIRVQGEHSSRDRIDIRPSESVVTIKPVSSMGAPRSIDLQISVPTWMKIDLTGTYADVTVEGSQGEIAIETVRGDLTVKGGAGYVSLKSVEGAVSLENATGRISLRSVNEGISVANCSGEVFAETVNGDVTLSKMQASSVDAATVNGDVSFDGAIRDSGQYQLTTHNGDITVAVAENTNATISVRTFNGEFEAGFPVKIQDTSGRNKRFHLVIGTGSARVDLESFGGTISLDRPGASGARRRKHHEREERD